MIVLNWKRVDFNLMYGRIFLMMRLVRHWNRLPRDDVDALSLEVFKAGSGGALSSLMLLKDVPTMGLD